VPATPLDSAAAAAAAANIRPEVVAAALLETADSAAVGNGGGGGARAVVPVGKRVVLGHLPSNQRLERVLEQVREQVNIAKFETEGLSPTGEQLLVDTERLVDTATHFLREKNQGDKLQKLAKESYLAQRHLTAHAHNVRDSWEELEGYHSDSARSLARETLRTARMVSLEMVRSAKSRAQLRALADLLADAISSSSSSPVPTSLPSAPPTEAGDQANLTAAAPTSAMSSPTGGGSSSSSSMGMVVASGEEVEIPIRARRADQLGHKLKEGTLRLGKRRLQLNREQLNELADRSLSLLREMTKRAKTSDLLKKLVNMLRLYEQDLLEASDGAQVTRSLHSMADNEHLRRSLILAQEVFESFTGPHSLDPLLSDVKAIFSILRRDEDARAFFRSLHHFFAGVIDHPDSLNSLETRKRLKKHLRWARQLHDQKLYHHLASALEEVRCLLRQAEQDPTLLRLRKDAHALLADIMLNEQGTVVLKPHVLEQLRLILIQSLVERARIPIPTISVNNLDLEMRLTNVVVILRDLIPESMHMKNSGRLGLNLTNLKEGFDTSSEGEQIVFKMKNVNLHIEDANIWFKRKNFPKLEDQGKICINIGGSGVDLKVVLRVHVNAQDMLVLEKVDCDVHNLQLHLSETRHNFLWNVLAKVLTKRFKHNIEQSIEDNITDYLQRLNRLLSKQILLARSKGHHLVPLTSLKQRIIPTPKQAVPSRSTGTTRLGLV